MDGLPTNISLARLPTELQVQIYHAVHESSPSRSIVPKIQAPVTSTHKTGISLLVLPTEIRHQIYRDVFYERYIIPSFTELTFSDPAPSYAGNRISNTSLLQTCKDLHEDALEFMYANVTFRMLFPLGTQETLIGPSQSIIDRMEHVEIDIDMRHYLSPNNHPTVWGTATDSELMDIFYSTMLCKLSARETPGVACRIVFRHCDMEQLPWDKLPFFAALKRVPRFRMVTMELISRFPPFWPRFGSLHHLEICFLCDKLEDKLRRSLQTTIRLHQCQDNGMNRCLELHPQENVAKETMADQTLAEGSSDNDEASEEGAGEEDLSEKDAGDENTGEDDSGEADFDEDDSDGEDCFEDWRWRSL